MAEVNDEGIRADLIRNLDDEDKEVLAPQIAGSAPLDGDKEVVAEPVGSTNNGEKREGIAQAIQAAPLDARKAAVAQAVISASPENKKDVVKEPIESLPSTERQELANQFGPTQAVTDKVWLTVVDAFKWVLWGATLALVVAIGVALFREVNEAYVQILLTMFTTVVGIFAGFISGKALGNSNGQ
jgi:hypothetical protein